MPALPPTMIRPTHSHESLLIDSFPSFLLPVACLTSSPFSRGRHYITYVACCERSLKDICINCCREFQFTQSFPDRLRRLLSSYISRLSSINMYFPEYLKIILQTFSYKYHICSCANIFNTLLYLILLCYFYVITLSSLLA